MPTHDPHDPHHSTDPYVAESESVGYEVTDVEVNGIAVFLASLAAQRRQERRARVIRAQAAERRPRQRNADPHACGPWSALRLAGCVP